MRIVSLLPAATEILCALGLEDEIVGTTHECDYPPSLQKLPRVTRTLIPPDASSLEIDALVRERLKTQAALYSLDMEFLERLRPDLLVTQALCDVCAVAAAEVQEASCRLPGHPRVLNLEPMSLTDVFETLRQVGVATGREARAAEVVDALERRVEAVRARTAVIPQQDRPRVAFLEWIDPPFSAGHWNPALIELAGGEDIFGVSGLPSRTLLWDEIVQAQPDVLFVSCCGFFAHTSLGRNRAGAARRAVCLLLRIYAGAYFAGNAASGEAVRVGEPALRSKWPCHRFRRQCLFQPSRPAPCRQFRDIGTCATSRRPPAA